MLERAYMREGELGLLAGVVGARTRASALLVGPSSVGKTCLVHELAHRALDPASALHGLEIYSTTGGRIVAGMRYLGEWQARVTRMLGELRERRAVLHIESLAELLSVGTGLEVLDVAGFLLPAVEAGEVSLIVEATAEDVARAERTHAALVQAMRTLVVRPLDAGAARQALDMAAGRIARARKAKFELAALDRALDLTERFGEGALPGGAVELLRAASHEAAAVGPGQVTAAFARRTGYPRELVDPAVRLDPDAVRAHFRSRVIGQDEAVELFTNLVVTLKTNLADPARPLGSFLLLGPTGVGKTESALALAAYLFGDDKRLARFDMAEYAAPGSAARLTSMAGAESTLAKRVREQPFGVVLLDEIEKADGGVHDLLLQILGEGRLTDGTGRTVSFKNTIVVLTSNLGADSAGRSLGFGAGGIAAHEAHYRAAAAAFFRPELLNRFDQVVPYLPLSADVVARIARKALEQALAREGLARRGVRVEVDDAVVARLAALGFEPKLGARPLKRAIETHVIAPLARLLAAAGRGAPKTVRIGVGEGAAIVVI
jgi:ATP-dependent Clp protease ATP-binding subunit ClpC